MTRNNLSIYADMVIVVEDKDQIRILADGGRVIHIHIPSVQSLANIWLRHRTILLPIIAKFDNGIDLLNVEFKFMHNDRLIAEFKRDQSGGIVSRLLNIPNLKVSLGNLIRGWFKP